MSNRLYAALQVPALLALWLLPSPWSKVAALVVLGLVLTLFTRLALEVYRWPPLRRQLRRHQAGAYVVLSMALHWLSRRLDMLSGRLMGRALAILSAEIPWKAQP